MQVKHGLAAATAAFGTVLTAFIPGMEELGPAVTTIGMALLSVFHLLPEPT